LLLRFFEDRTHRDIASLLGIGEDAVRKRVELALARLSELFRRRGYALPPATATKAL
jgi:DNA-directed RNA polymerase specialized sigma24 family protein